MKRFLITISLLLLKSILSPAQDNTLTGYTGIDLNRGSWPYIRFLENGTTMARIQGTGGLFTVTSANGGTNYFTVNTTSGNVGIGTSSPSNTQGWDRVLNIDGTGNSKMIASSAGQSYRVGIYSNSTWNGGGGFIGTETNHNLNFITNYTSRMTLDVNGNLAIGTATPQSLLHINSGVERNTFRIYKSTTTNNYLSIWQGDAAAAIDPIGTGSLRLGYDQSTNVIMGITGTGLVSGNVGIGTTSPNDKLSVSGGAITLDADQPLRGGGKWLISGNASQVTVGTSNTGVSLRFDAGSPNRMFVDGTSGNVGIGTTSPGSYKLAVEGKIGAREVNVTATNPWPDYVFEKNYKLPSLEEIKNYIDKNQHLPEVPSAKEVEKNGVNLGEMNALLLKKIEELTLFVIEQREEIKNLKQEISNIKNTK